MPDEPRRIAVKTGEMAAMLGVNPSTLYRWCQTTDVPHRRIRRTYWFSPTAVEAWFRAGND